jgi:hypothetical protein
MSFYVSLRNAFSLFVYDVSNPADPVWIGRTEVPGGPKSIQAAGRCLYAAGGTLLIYEITDEPAFRSMSRTEETLILTWNAPLGFKLQSATSLTEPVWRDVPDVGDETRVELPLGGGSEFFRLYKP